MYLLFTCYNFAQVRRAGFCYRNAFDKFLRRFAILTPETFPRWNGHPHDGIKHIMQSADMDPKEWQLGANKVFIKAVYCNMHLIYIQPESLFLLEEQRDRKYHTYARKIQRVYRRWKSRKYFIEMRKKAADVMHGQKQRNRNSLNRQFLGDYLSFLDNPVLKALVGIYHRMPPLIFLVDIGKKERVFFADNCEKYDRKFKSVRRECLLTETDFVVLGMEKEKEGPNKGKLVKVVKRRIPFRDITGISLSTMADDFFVLHVGSAYDSVMSSVFKTELVTVLAEKFAEQGGRKLKITFSNSYLLYFFSPIRIKYNVKKTTWQSGGMHELRFSADSTVKFPTVKPPNGKVCEVRVPQGLPADSRPIERSVMGFQGRKTHGGSHATHQPAYSRPAQMQQPSYGGASQQNTYTAPVANQFQLPATSQNHINTSNSSLSAAAKKKPPPPRK